MATSTSRDNSLSVSLSRPRFVLQSAASSRLLLPVQKRAFVAMNNDRPRSRRLSRREGCGWNWETGSKR